MTTETTTETPTEKRRRKWLPFYHDAGCVPVCEYVTRYSASGPVLLDHSRYHDCLDTLLRHEVDIRTWERQRGRQHPDRQVARLRASDLRRASPFAGDETR